VALSIAAGGDSHSGPLDTTNTLLVGATPAVPGAAWRITAEGDLRLAIPAGEAPLQFVLWQTRPAASVSSAVPSIGPFDRKAAHTLADAHRELRPANLSLLTRGGPSRWPELVTTQPVASEETGPFAVDVLAPPDANPWLCQLRLTGFDFFPDGNRAAVCSWDGDVWLVLCHSLIVG
jgi:hypothetical protein